jgi:hypothetical protein
LLVGVGIVLALQLAAMYSPPLCAVLGTGPVSVPVLWFCAAGVLAIVVVTEATKQAVAVVQRPGA